MPEKDRGQRLRAPESSSITQRWKHTEEEEDPPICPPAPAPKNQYQRPPPPLFSSKRLCAECIVLLLILIWLSTLALLFQSREQGCRIFTSATAQARGRFIRIKSYNALNWHVG